MERAENSLIIPVYLNQRIVFDLLAMLQGGISTLTRVSSTESTSNIDNQKYGASFGVNQVLSTLLKIDLSGSRDKKHEGASEVKNDEERYHTPTSLFYRLREIITKNNQVITVDDNFTPIPHQIIEFTAYLKRNPLIQVMDTMIALVDMAMVFSEESQESKETESQE